MKRILTLGLLAFVGFGFSGCGDDFCAEVRRGNQNIFYANKFSYKMCGVPIVTRTDAEIAKAKANIVTAYYDFDAYYNSMGKFDKIENMTNVPKEIKVNEEICARFNVKNENEIEIITSKEGNCEDVMMDIKEQDLKANQVSKGKIIIK